MSVACDCFLKARNARIKDIAVHCKTMSWTLDVRWNGASKSEKIYVLISVVVLENTSNLLDHLQVLISVRIKVVERVLRSWMAV